MVVSTTTLIKDSVLLLRSRLASQVTDPISTARPSASQFVVTANPDKLAVYPLITVKHTDLESIPAGARSEEAFVRLYFEIRVWARNEREKDTLSQSVYDALRTYQFGTSEAVANGLHNFRVDSAIPVDEPGKDGVKSKIFTVSYLFIATT